MVQKLRTIVLLYQAVRCFLEAKKPSVNIDTDKNHPINFDVMHGVQSYHYPYLLILMNLQFMIQGPGLKKPTELVLVE